MEQDKNKLLDIGTKLEKETLSNKSMTALAGLVYCKRCGKLMIPFDIKSNRKNSSQVLRCENRCCKNTLYDIELVESEIIKALEGWLAGYEQEFAKQQDRRYEELSIYATINGLEEYVDRLTKKVKADEVFIPKCRQVLNTYYTLDDLRDRNELLKSVLTKVQYCKIRANKKNEDIADFAIEVFPSVLHTHRGIIVSVSKKS